MKGVGGNSSPHRGTVNIFDGSEIGNALSGAPVAIAAPDLSNESVGVHVYNTSTAVAINADATPDPSIFIVLRPWLLYEPFSRGLLGLVFFSRDIRGDLADLTSLIPRCSTAGQDVSARHNSCCGSHDGFLSRRLSFRRKSAKNVGLRSAGTDESPVRYDKGLIHIALVPVRIMRDPRRFEVKTRSYFEFAELKVCLLGHCIVAFIYAALTVLRRWVLDLHLRKLLIGLHEGMEVAQPVTPTTNSKAWTKSSSAISVGSVPRNTDAIAHARIPKEKGVSSSADIIFVIFAQATSPRYSTVDLALRKHKGNQFREIGRDEILNVVGNDDLASSRNCFRSHDADSFHLLRFASSDCDYMAGANPDG
ncbi:hypothetical protein HG530_009000 [Fusarium avenaceum]|nr:hypothetical protein HG530_009000 [Fusarium avenaceum]